MLPISQKELSSGTSHLGKSLEIWITPCSSDDWLATIESFCLYLRLPSFFFFCCVYLHQIIVPTGFPSTAEVILPGLCAFTT